MSIGRDPFFRPGLISLSISGAFVRRRDEGRNSDPLLSCEGDNPMRFCVMVRATKESESGAMPSEKLLAEMGRYNEELVKAGVMLAGEGLHPSSKGARIRFSGDKRTVIDGPFTETKELVAEY